MKGLHDEADDKSVKSDLILYNHPSSVQVHVWASRNPAKAQH